MSDKSKIEWTEATWNPIRGCSRVSEGCRNCYAEAVAARFSQPGQAYEGLAVMAAQGPRWTGKVRMVPEHLQDPLRWKRPRRIFVNSMSDLFHESLSDADIDEILAVMALAPQHIFQVLTKRAERMHRYLTPEAHQRALGRAWTMLGAYDMRKYVHHDICSRPFPLPNLWLGVSVEDQATAEERIPWLLQTPAAIRWASAEPLLGPIEFRALAQESWHFNALTGDRFFPTGARRRCYPPLDWIVPGGESGAHARVHEIAWTRSIVQQCEQAGCACFVKQMGSRPESIPDKITYRDSITPLPAGCYRFLRDHKDPSEFPEDLRVRQYPTRRSNDDQTS